MCKYGTACLVAEISNCVACQWKAVLSSVFGHTAERRVHSLAILCGICEQISTGTGFFRVPQIFPVSISLYHCFVLKFG